MILLKMAGCPIEEFEDAVIEQLKERKKFDNLGNNSFRDRP